MHYKIGKPVITKAGMSHIKAPFVVVGVADFTIETSSILQFQLELVIVSPWQSVINGRKCGNDEAGIDVIGEINLSHGVGLNE